jgi:hypothetical protein
MANRWCAASQLGQLTPPKVNSFILTYINTNHSALKLCTSNMYILWLM